MRRAAATIVLLLGTSMLSPGGASPHTGSNKGSDPTEVLEKLRAYTRTPREMHINRKIASEVRPASARSWVRPARATARPTPCSDDPSWLCGSVKVPLDRTHPQGPKIDVAYELLPRRNDASRRLDPVVVTAGGPGDSTTGERYFRAFVTHAMLDERDLLLIDPRGTGKSEALRCEALQQGWSSQTELVADVAACGTKLGPASDRYGSGSIARDVEAVRRALGYRRINYVSASYATVHEQAYAALFPDHLRSIVADAGLTVTDPEHTWQWGFGKPDAFVRAAALACSRAPSCAATHPSAGRLLAKLAERVAEKPIKGTGYDAFGQPHEVVLGEVELAGIVDLHSLNPGEIAAAALALSRGDPGPLLRLGAESPPWPDTLGDPRFFSMGANAATYCNDQDSVWQRDWSRERRAEAYDDALEDMPKNAFAPFTVEGWAGYFWPDFCIGWPAPDHFTPAVPANVSFPQTPVLVLSGDIDTSVPTEMTSRLTDMFPNATQIDVAGAAHPAMGWSPCAAAIAARFVDTLRPGNISCADTPAFVGAAVPEYALKAAEVTAARPIEGSEDESTRRDRRIATAVTRTVLDAWLRSYRQPAIVATGRGLRGGAFDADYKGVERAKVVLRGARWVRDVSVGGHSTWTYALNLIEGQVHFTGPGSESGQLHLAGRWGFGGPFGQFTMRGAIGDRTIAARLPAN